LLRRDRGVNPPLVELVVVGHVDVACVCPQVSYLAVPCFEYHCQAVDTLSGSGELLGSNVCPPFNGVGKTEGHGSHDLAKFVFAEMNEGLH
jgi:hypothetical protein